VSEQIGYTAWHIEPGDGSCLHGIRNGRAQILADNVALKEECSDMAKTDVRMPQMGESINEGTLTVWHKKVGQTVEREEILFEISTDKVDTEIPSPVSGVLVETLAKEGDTVTVNAVVARIETDAAAAQAAPPKSGGQPEPAAAPPSSAPTPNQAATRTEPDRAHPPSSASTERVAASPLARKMAGEHGIDLAQVSGTGLGGRIGKQDLLDFLQGKPQLVQDAAAPLTAAVQTAPVQHIMETGGSLNGLIDGVRVERVPMSTMRRKIAEHMVMSKHTSPHVTSVIEVDMQKVVDLRAQAKKPFEKANGFNLTFMPFFMHAALQAIKAVPIANASVDGNSILYKKDVNLGIAVAMDSGLIVPVIKHAADKSFLGLARDLNDLAERARNKKLAPDDVRGGTFSISNFGGFGTIIGQPIINQPQVAIMGIGAMTKKAVVVNDAIAIRTMVYVVLSFDHRVLDGSDSGKFLSTVKNTLENWNLPVV
jgi:pyruvate dehydrogenase E2 component (dihydrolipoamide acetyltransferase)